MNVRMSPVPLAACSSWSCRCWRCLRRGPLERLLLVIPLLPLAKLLLRLLLLLLLCFGGRQVVGRAGIARGASAPVGLLPRWGKRGCWSCGGS